MKTRLLLGLLVTSAAFATPRMAAQTPAIWVDVPFVAQAKEGCGSASISMIMRYWDNKDRRTSTPVAEADKIQAKLFSPSANGILASSMQTYFQNSGYRAFAFGGEWADLIYHLEKGRPLIVGLKANGVRGSLHYVVVAGIDQEREFIFVNDPAQQKMLRISREGFESEWAATGNWTLLAVPRAGR